MKSWRTAGEHQLDWDRKLAEMRANIPPPDARTLQSKENGRSKYRSKKYKAEAEAS